MSLEAMTWALSANVGSATRKLVLMGLANHAHRDGRNAYASQRTIAEYVECDPKTVKRQLEQLCDEGWIRRGDQRAVAHIRGDRRPVVYDLAMGTTRRNNWRAAAAGEDQNGRGDNLSPRDGEVTEPAHTATDAPRGDTATTPRPAGHGGTYLAPRGDRAVSPEPSTEPTTPPQPPVPGGASRDRHTQPAGPADAGADELDTPLLDLPTPAPPTTQQAPARVVPVDPHHDLSYDPRGDVGPIQCCPKHPEDPVWPCRGCRTTPRQMQAWSKAQRHEAKRKADAQAAEESRRRREQITPDVATAGAAAARQSLLGATPLLDRRVRKHG